MESTYLSHQPTSKIGSHVKAEIHVSSIRNQRIFEETTEDLRDTIASSFSIWLTEDTQARDDHRAPLGDKRT